jgi:hypothetical protein
MALLRTTCHAADTYYDTAANPAVTVHHTFPIASLYILLSKLF